MNTITSLDPHLELSSQGSIAGVLRALADLPLAVALVPIIPRRKAATMEPVETGPAQVLALQRHLVPTKRAWPCACISPSN